MNRPHSLPLLMVILAGCAASTTSERHAGVYAILDPATGLTYNGVSLSVRGTAMYQRSQDSCCRLQAF
jgi:hypothetical protein